MAWTSTEQTIPSWRERIAALVHQAAARLRGPGGYYNIGNAFGLGMGIALQMESIPAGRSGLEAAADAATSYLLGNPAATALTLGTAVFFWSGEMYHRAWANGAPPNPVLNRRGDLSSGLGALILFVALLSLGHVMLAVTAGLLHALGKFGSAGKWRPHPRLARDLARLLPHPGAREPRPRDPRQLARPRPRRRERQRRHAGQRLADADGAPGLLRRLVQGRPDALPRLEAGAQPTA